ncbi:amino acid-binding protein [Hippea maritima]|uniref:Amino acid-binding ACT domain protein n=1 Tax=Hippea maritima (strain ATCC 700847 / DSM 10411 / MH2) TaxID=760142 RepID=F2LX69_HIPMA|nr:amino acid-binding protein [Hippea maritima]AEA33127.1 amino acid-binding ACT domain protein [Hippea maritima DSM 10411]
MDRAKFKIPQISVFIENKKGRFYSVTRVLKEAGVNIRAMSLADTMDFGILRFVVDKPKEAYDALVDANFIVKKNDVMAIAIKDECGGLSELLKTISDLDLNVEYMYTFVNAMENKAVMLFRFEDIDKAIESLHKEGVELLTEQFFKEI